MSIRFACPSCNATLKADSSGVGRKIPCPGCGAAVRVPSMPDGEPTEAPAKEWPWRLVLRVATDLASAAVWLTLLAWCGWWMVKLVSGLRQSESAVQQAAGAAIVAAFLVGGYAIARAIETILARVGAWSRR